jgi:hypothetical protein
MSQLWPVQRAPPEPATEKQPAQRVAHVPHEKTDGWNISRPKRRVTVKCCLKLLMNRDLPPPPSTFQGRPVELFPALAYRKKSDRTQLFLTSFYFDFIRAKGKMFFLYPALFSVFFYCFFFAADRPPYL